MKAHRAVFPVRAMCRVLGLSPSGFYAWLKRPRSASALRDDALRVLVRRSWEASRRTYGRPRIHADLAAWGERVGPKRVARLMREEGIEGASRRRRKVALTVRDADARPAPDLVERDFSADGPDQLWVADITYVSAGAGWLCLAVVDDAWSRRVVGAMCESFFATLECELLDRCQFTSPAEARRAVFAFIEGFYNSRRRHSALGCESPAGFERKHAVA